MVAGPERETTPSGEAAKPAGPSIQTVPEEPGLTLTEKEEPAGGASWVPGGGEKTGGAMVPGVAPERSRKLLAASIWLGSVNAAGDGRLTMEEEMAALRPVGGPESVRKFTWRAIPAGRMETDQSPTRWRWTSEGWGSTSGSCSKKRTLEVTGREAVGGGAGRLVGV
jgi:hypothetical protein